LSAAGIQGIARILELIGLKAATGGLSDEGLPLL
jgi:hypothetical protein